MVDYRNNATFKSAHKCTVTDSKTLNALHHQGYFRQMSLARQRQR